ncbi:MAG: hypothetical protein ACHQF4_04535 [Sphingobacteriales bacterium]
MDALYTIGGFICLTFGIWLTIKQIKIFWRGEQDKFGNDIKGLGVGIMFMMIGVFLIINYI